MFSCQIPQAQAVSLGRPAFFIAGDRRKERSMQTCQDNYSTVFSSFGEMQTYHQRLSQESQWRRCRVPGPDHRALGQQIPLWRKTFPPLPQAPAKRLCGTPSEAWAWPCGWRGASTPCGTPPTKACWTGPNCGVPCYRSSAAPSWPVPSLSGGRTTTWQRGVEY